MKFRGFHTVRNEANKIGKKENEIKGTKSESTNYWHMKQRSGCFGNSIEEA